MMEKLRKKLNSRWGISRLAVILIVLIVILSIVVMVPTYQKYQNRAKKLACYTALDTARRELITEYMFDGFESGSAEEAKEFLTHVMNGWEDLCPDGGDVYIVPKSGAGGEWEVVCGLHCSDDRLRTRLNASNVLDQLRENLRKEQLRDNMYPETLPFVLHHKHYLAELVDEPTGLKRGTRTTMGRENDGIVAYYSIAGHSDFGADSEMKDGEIWYFSFADVDHCANWENKEQWTGDSYDNVTGTEYHYLW